MEPFPEPGLFTTCMRVYIQGGTLKLLLPIPEPSQNITWLKNDFKLRALRRGKDGAFLLLTSGQSRSIPQLRVGT